MSLIVGTCKYSSTPHERRKCCVNFTPVAPEVLGTCDAHPLDADRDYEAGFDEIFGTAKSAFNADLETLIRRNRED